VAVLTIRRGWFQLILEAKRLCCYEKTEHPCHWKGYYQADFKGNREKYDMAEIEQIKRKQSNDKIFTLLGCQAALIGS
jgi:hypothetical protein